MTFVLIPGAGGDAWFWYRLVAELERRGCTAVAVDLPAGDDRAGWVEYADAVVAAARGVDDAVLVAQSMGGFTAPLVCDRLPVRLLVLLNAMIPVAGETGGAWWENTGQAKAQAELAAAQGRVVSEGIDVLVDFFHDVPAEVTAEAMRRGDPSQSMTPFSRPWPLDRWPDVPTRVVGGRDDRLFPVEFQRRVARERLGLDIDVIPGGHLAALSVPSTWPTAWRRTPGSRESCVRAPEFCSGARVLAPAQGHAGTMTAAAVPVHMTGHLAPVADEIDAVDLPVDGRAAARAHRPVPAQRPQPAAGRSRPRTGSPGHGMVHGIRLREGRAEWYRNRWVRTKALRAQSMFGPDGRSTAPSASPTPTSSPHAGRIMALVESSFPHVLTPELGTVGPCDFGGRLTTAMTAHPKTDPTTGELHFFGYGFAPPFLTYHALGRRASS